MKISYKKVSENIDTLQEIFRHTDLLNPMHSMRSLHSITQAVRSQDVSFLEKVRFQQKSGPEISTATI